jgi:hypothetical protein
MKIIDTHDPLGEAVEYARASQHHGKSCVLSFARGLVIVRHANGHARAFRKLDGVVLMNRLLANFEVEGGGR